MTQTEADCRIEIWHAIINYFEITDPGKRSDLLIHLLDEPNDCHIGRSPLDHA